MANEHSKIEYESGVTPYLMAAITDSGDHKTYTTEVDLFARSNNDTAPVVLPNGILNGGLVTPDIADSSVAVTATLCNLGGVADIVIAASTVAITRPATNVASVTSITITSAGALAAVKGTDGTNGTFSEVRGAAGAPPYIPVGSIELAQVRVASSTAAVITRAEIFAVENTHRELANYPSYEVKDFSGLVVFDAALPLIHTGEVPKKVYASYADPVFSDQKYGNDFAPPDSSYSSVTEQTYDGLIPVGYSESLGKCSFTALLKDGVSDPILAQDGKVIFVRYYPDRYKTEYILVQGKVSFGRSFKAAAALKVTVNIAVSQKSENRLS